MKVIVTAVIRSWAVLENCLSIFLLMDACRPDKFHPFTYSSACKHTLSIWYAKAVSLEIKLRTLLPYPVSRKSQDMSQLLGPKAMSPDNESMAAVQALLHAKEKTDPHGWQQFQQKMQTLKLQRTRTMREAEDMQAALQANDFDGALPAPIQISLIKHSLISGLKQEGGKGQLLIRTCCLISYQQIKLSLWCRCRPQCSAHTAIQVCSLPGSLHNFRVLRDLTVPLRDQTFICTVKTS